MPYIVSNFVYEDLSDGTGVFACRILRVRVVIFMLCGSESGWAAVGWSG